VKSTCEGLVEDRHSLCVQRFKATFLHSVIVSKLFLFPSQPPYLVVREGGGGGPLNTHATWAAGPPAPPPPTPTHTHKNSLQSLSPASNANRLMAARHAPESGGSVHSAASSSHFSCMHPSDMSIHSSSLAKRFAFPPHPP
jgi:hypothetical protein